MRGHIPILVRIRQDQQAS